MNYKYCFALDPPFTEARTLAQSDVLPHNPGGSMTIFFFRGEPPPPSKKIIIECKWWSTSDHALQRCLNGGIAQSSPSLAIPLAYSSDEIAAEVI